MTLMDEYKQRDACRAEISGAIDRLLKLGIPAGMIVEYLALLSVRTVSGGDSAASGAASPTEP